MPISYPVIRQTVEFAAKSGVRHALVAQRASLQAELGQRDIDLIVAPQDLRLLSLSLIKQFENAGFGLINLIRNDYSEQLYFQAQLGLLHIDLMPRLTYRGMEFLELPLNDHQVQEFDGMRVVSEPWLVTYSFLRNLLWSGKLDKRYNQRLDDLLANPEHTAVLRESLAAAVGKGTAKQMLEDIKDPAEIAARSRSIRRKFVWRQLRKRPLPTISGVLRHFYLLSRRFLQYPGLMVVLLARDASGKTAILDGIETAFAEYGIVVCHCANDSSTSTNAKLWKQLEGNCIVLMDRCCRDPLIDFSQRRSRAGEWLARCLNPLSLRPDLWLLLDGSLEGSRSGEQPSQQTPREEKNRQSSLECSSVNSIGNHLILDASQATHAVVADAFAAIMDTLAQRADKRLKSRF